MVFFDYAGTTSGKYKGVRPALMLLKKEFVSSINQIGYIKTRSVTDNASIVIPESNLDELVDEILKPKDEYDNLTDYGAYAMKPVKSSLSNLSRSIYKRTPDIEINPLDDDK